MRSRILLASLQRVWLILRRETDASKRFPSHSIVIILNVEVLGVEDKIGNPTTIENLTGGPGNAAAASASTTAASTSAPADAISAQPAAGAAAVGRGGSNASKTAAAKRGGAAQGRRGAQGGSLADSPIYPIESLSPYQNKCVESVPRGRAVARRASD